MERADQKEKRMKVEDLERLLDILSNEKVDPLKRCEQAGLRLAWYLGKQNAKASAYVQISMGL